MVFAGCFCTFVHKLWLRLSRDVLCAGNCFYLERCLDLRTQKGGVMFPVWFFILLVIFICYLCYVTSIREEEILGKDKEQVSALQYWMNDEGAKI